jgi:nucleoside-triphosphatase
MLPQNFLLTGPPGSGKTTVIRAVAERLRDLSPTGFYTEEIRQGGIRTGFELVSLEGERAILAHAEGKKGPSVGRYRVDVEGFDRFWATLTFDASLHDLIVIDEIGKMEWMSTRFRMLIETLLDSPVPLLATIALHGNAKMEAIKRRPDVEVTLLTRENRESLVPVLADTVRRSLRSSPVR